MACAGAGDELLTLPPLVEGTVRGELELRLGPLVWERPQGSAHAPEECRVRVLWWGDSSGGALLPVGAAGAAPAASPGAYPPAGLPHVGELRLPLNSNCNVHKSALRCYRGLGRSARHPQ